MTTKKPKPSEADKTKPLPVLFATIHFRSPERPDGYTDEDIAELNRLGNLPPKSE